MINLAMNTVQEAHLPMIRRAILWTTDEVGSIEIQLQHTSALYRHLVLKRLLVARAELVIRQAAVLPSTWDRQLSIRISTTLMELSF